MTNPVTRFLKKYFVSLVFETTFVDQKVLKISRSTGMSAILIYFVVCASLSMPSWSAQYVCRSGRRSSISPNMNFPKVSIADCACGPTAPSSPNSSKNRVTTGVAGHTSPLLLKVRISSAASTISPKKTNCTNLQSPNSCNFSKCSSRLSPPYFFHFGLSLRSISFSSRSLATPSITRLDCSRSDIPCCSASSVHASLSLAGHESQ